MEKRSVGLLIGFSILTACQGKSAPPPGASTHSDSAQTAHAVAGSDCASRIEDWAPGNYDRHTFEDSITNLTGYKNGAGEIVIAARFQAAYEFGPGGVAAAIDGSTPFVFIDPNGKVIAHAYGMDNGPDYFQEGVARIVANKKIGFMTDHGAITVAPQFDRAGSFCHGKAEVERAGEKYYIDTRGIRTSAPAPPAGN